MSYEKKMKDLLGRLVGMSPEPPPYPEETYMAARHKTRKRPHPALVFAGAAAVVAALAVPVILLTGGEGPLAGDTTTTIRESTSTSRPAASSTTTAPQTESTLAPMSTWSGVVYLYQTPENSFLGNPALVPIELDVTDPNGGLTANAYFTQALRAVGVDLPPGLVNGIPEDVQVLDINLADPDVLRVDMNEAFVDGAGGLLADFTMLNQIVYTLYREYSERPVLFTVDGEPVDAFGSEGLDLTDPVDHQTFIEELAVIFLNEPVMEMNSQNGYFVQGVANTFEGSLTVRVIDEEGNTVHEEPLQATCGSGCWGGFGVVIHSDLVEPGESSIQLFTYSAEDGSMTDVITVPVLINGLWAVTLD